jgi:hypothetical protein
MRGAPWIRFAIMAAILAVLAVPLLMLTRDDDLTASPVAEVQFPSAEREVTLEIETAPSAQVIGASYLGQQLIPTIHNGGSFFGMIRLPAGTGVDLVVTATWDGTNACAMRVRAHDETGLLAEASFWGAEKVQEVFTIPEVP